MKREIGPIVVEKNEFEKWGFGKNKIKISQCYVQHAALHSMSKKWYKELKISRNL